MNTDPFKWLQYFSESLIILEETLQLVDEVLYRAVWLVLTQSRRNTTAWTYLSWYHLLSLTAYLTTLRYPVQRMAQSERGMSANIL